ncbi:uncharacterized protein LOC125654171 isoform X3 [Ostrea edulis]|uniref:uncharacterized protein LOC125654171 isoform X3 n=1 Tax=Ostrea edulis TaxID=37623 RepID=UPI0024AF9E3A|nr:uncharacterized protein LOC125654171 isoform X3 [Ostrea edulis]
MNVRVRETVDTEMANPDLYITESCEPVFWDCSAGTLLIDPCSCFRYYECKGHGNGVVERTCALGTAYSNSSKTCVNEKTVLRTECTRNLPWGRCGLNDTESLVIRCTNQTTRSTSNSITTTQNPVTKSSSNGSDGNEAGIIVGALFGGLFVVVVAILIAVLFHRHREKKKTKLTKKRSVQNPEYNFQPESPVEEEEETYHVIDDNMNDPEYRGDFGTAHPPSVPYRAPNGDTIGGPAKSASGINFTMHNNDNLTSKHEQSSSQNGTINILHKDTDDAPAQEEEAGYIAIFPQDTPDAEISPRDVTEETPYDNSFVIHSEVSGEDTRM